GDLFDDELVIRQIAIEGIDDPIAIKPDEAAFIFFESIRISVTRRIEPLTTPPFAIMRRRQQPLYLLFVRFWAFVSQKGVQFCDGRREADEVEADPSKQCDLVRFGRRLEILLFEARENKTIYRIARPLWVFDAWQRSANRRYESPMFARVLGVG